MEAEGIPEAVKKVISIRKTWACYESKHRFSSLWTVAVITSLLKCIKIGHLHVLPCPCLFVVIKFHLTLLFADIFSVVEEQSLNDQRTHQSVKSVKGW